MGNLFLLTSIVPGICNPFKIVAGGGRRGRRGRILPTHLWFAASLGSSVECGDSFIPDLTPLLFPPGANLYQPPQYLPSNTPHGECLCGAAGMSSASALAEHLFPSFFFAVLDEAALLPRFWLSPSPVLCTVNPSGASQQNRINWHGDRQELETEAFLDRAILCCGSFSTAPHN